MPHSDTNLPLLPADGPQLNVLRWAAVLGSWLDLELIAAVAEMPLEQVRRLVGLATRQHVLNNSGQPGMPSYRFSSDEIREMAEATLSADELARRHRRVAELLRTRAHEDTIADQLAWHYERADDFAAALRYAWRAAESALRRSAVESALEQYTRALRLAEAQRPQLVDLDEYALRSGHAECCRRLGRIDAEYADLERMAEIADTASDVDLQLEVLILQSALDRYRGDLDSARARAEQALDMARHAGDIPLQAEALNALGRAYNGLSDYPHAEELHTRALELFIELEDQAGEAASRYALGDIGRLTGRLDGARSAIHHALDLFRLLAKRMHSISLAIFQPIMPRPWPIMKKHSLFGDQLVKSPARRVPTTTLG
jgi:tetratricopeptide (TPR) repeat protein